MLKTSLVAVLSIVLLLFGSAVNAAKLQKYDPQVMYAPDQAIVIIKLQNLSYVILSRLHKADSSVMNELTIMRPMRSFVPYSYAHSIYTIRPGIYYISFLKYQTDRKLYYTIDDGVAKDGTIAYGAYNIMPGTVLYLGDLECEWRTNSRVSKLLQKDNLSEVKQDLYKDGYEELAQKITLAQFYSHGSNIEQIESANNNLTK